MDEAQRGRLKTLGYATGILMKPGRVGAYRLRPGAPAVVRVRGRRLHGKARRRMQAARHAAKAGGWSERSLAFVARLLARRRAWKLARKARCRNRR